MPSWLTQWKPATLLRDFFYMYILSIFNPSDFQGTNLSRKEYMFIKSSSSPSPQPNMYVEVRPPKTDLICMQLTNEVTISIIPIDLPSKMQLSSTALSMHLGTFWYIAYQLSAIDAPCYIANAPSLVQLVQLPISLHCENNNNSNNRNNNNNQPCQSTWSGGCENNTCTHSQVVAKLAIVSNGKV